jgi:LmbE family N-acetylglucosaminyl deacetylase
MRENNIPETAMVIFAHPDDAEFSVSGTVAKWANAGCRVIYVVCTDGNAGSHEPGMTREQLAHVRRTEQMAACAKLGVSDVEFLGYDDGQLMPTLELRKELVRMIRRYRPEVVITWEPMRFFGDGDYINHPDHRAAAQATLDALEPASAMPLLWPDAGSPHQVSQVYIYRSENPNHWVDITDEIDQKLAALKQHASQMGDWDPTARIKGRNARMGRGKGMAYAEVYRVITLGQPDIAVDERHEVRP